QGTAKAKELISKMDDARLMAIWTGTMMGKTLMAVPRIGVIRSLIMNHICHHRGQLSVYLRLLDVPVPSIYGPSVDEGWTPNRCHNFKMSHPPPFSWMEE